METLAELNPETKRELISLIDHRIEERLKDQAPLPMREDSSELKPAVQELARARKQTNRQIQRIARAVVGLEDIAHVVLPGYLERHLGIQIKGLSRKFFSVNGKEVEINLYGVGKKSGKRITVLGECKSRIYHREVRSFFRQVEKVQGLLKGDTQLVMFGYWIHPSASALAKEKDVHLVASYER